MSVSSKGYLLWTIFDLNALQLSEKRFPSPTGVNYYELFEALYGDDYEVIDTSFRPQQGLTIMNKQIKY